jgi:hypothetical protein
MSEFLKSKVIAFGLIIALGTSACSNDGSNKGAKETANPAPGKGPVSVSVTYYDNGTMITDYNASDTGASYAEIVSFCQGDYIVDQTEDYYRSGNSVARTLDIKACADGKLTASDFATSGSH